MKNKPLYFIDVETTGLSPQEDRIIEICIIKKSKDGMSIYHDLVDPEGVSVHPEAQKVNGYSPEKWLCSISQAEASCRVSEFMREEGIAVAHNVSFDAQFTNALLQKHGYKPLIKRRIDTYSLAYEHLVPMGLRSLSMDEIRLFMGWEIRKHHNAIIDTHDVYRLFMYIERMSLFKKVYLYLKTIPYRRK